MLFLAGITGGRWLVSIFSKSSPATWPSFGPFAHLLALLGASAQLLLLRLLSRCLLLSLGPIQRPLQIQLENIEGMTPWYISGSGIAVPVNDKGVLRRHCDCTTCKRTELMPIGVVWRGLTEKHRSTERKRKSRSI